MKEEKKKKHSDLTQNIFMCCAPLAKVNTVKPTPLHCTRQDSGLVTTTGGKKKKKKVRLAERYRHDTCVVLTIQKGEKKLYSIKTTDIHSLFCRFIYFFLFFTPWILMHFLSVSEVCTRGLNAL